MTRVISEKVVASKSVQKWDIGNKMITLAVKNGMPVLIKGQKFCSACGKDLVGRVRRTKRCLLCAALASGTGWKGKTLELKTEGENHGTTQGE